MFRLAPELLRESKRAGFDWSENERWWLLSDICALLRSTGSQVSSGSLIQPSFNPRLAPLLYGLSGE